MPQRKGREQHLRCLDQQPPKPTTVHLPLPKAPPKPKNDAPLPLQYQSVRALPWPGTDKVSGNLFEDRNWLLTPNYLVNGKEKDRK